MILALDVGNTNIVAGCIDEHSLHFGCRIATDREKTDMEYAVLFKNILDVHKIDPGHWMGGNYFLCRPAAEPCFGTCAGNAHRLRAHGGQCPYEPRPAN